jgi:hypothetical protein
VSTRRALLLILLASAVYFTAKSHRLPSVSADEWLPISAEELQVTSEPKAPGAPAIILYRQVDRDDSNAMTPHEYNYVRKKYSRRKDASAPTWKSRLLRRMKLSSISGPERCGPTAPS